MAEPIISVSGLRGVIGSELTPVVAGNYVAAFASTLKPGGIVIGRDGRASGAMIAQAVSSALLASGFDVIDAGVIATPTLGVLVRHMQCVGGVQISASHNPPVYNGLKLFNREGRVLPANDGVQVLNAYRLGQANWVDLSRLGKPVSIDDPHAPHLLLVMKTVNLEQIRRHRFRILLDSNHGAGSILGRRLLDMLGCDVELLGEQADGAFEHPPEPTIDNLGQVAARVREGGFAAGFCQDPDADRLAIIDEGGQYIGEEYTSVLCAWRRLEQEPGSLVTNCASSSMMRWLAKKYQVDFKRTKVGEANVVDGMIEQQAAYGGEGSGGPIDPKVGFVRDSFVGMAQVLDLMAHCRQPLSQLVSQLPQLCMLKDKIELAPQVRAAAFERLRLAFQGSELSDEDGLRFDWTDRWLLIRGSNTEPIVRIIAESPSVQCTHDLIRQAKSILE